MIKDEALNLALEALEYHTAQTRPIHQTNQAITAIKEALAEHPAPVQQKPVAWKLVPRDPTEEMLKAMDECSTEGYDERLYAGHAASVYMAAVDVAPSPQPAQQEPVAYIRVSKTGNVMACAKTGDFYKLPDKTLLYTTPPQRKPLSDEEIADIVIEMNGNYPTALFWRDLAKAIEAAHGIKVEA